MLYFPWLSFLSRFLVSAPTLACSVSWGFGCVLWVINSSNDTTTSNDGFMFGTVLEMTCQWPHMTQDDKYCRQVSSLHGPLRLDNVVCPCLPDRWWSSLSCQDLMLTCQGKWNSWTCNSWTCHVCCGARKHTRGDSRLCLQILTSHWSVLSWGTWDSIFEDGWDLCSPSGCCCLRLGLFLERCLHPGPEIAHEVKEEWWQHLRLPLQSERVSTHGKPGIQDQDREGWRQLHLL